MGRRILVRGAVLPWEYVDPIAMLQHDRTGTNIGNLLYQYSIIRSIMTDDTEIVMDDYSINPAKAAWINENFDAYVLALADAFRDDFENSLKSYTQIVSKLDIPVYVIGIGIRHRHDAQEDGTIGFAFDDAARNFVQAVCESTGTLGLRGESTGDYLQYLGFTPGQDYQVIGCPSMYAFGRELKVRDASVGADSLIAVNGPIKPTVDQIAFVKDMLARYENAWFIPQNYVEFVRQYMGGPMPADYVLGDESLLEEVHSTGRVKTFINAPSWIDFLKTCDVSVGMRLHGNIAATLAGTPSITIPIDERMRELARYHGLACLSPDSLIHSSRVEDMLEQVDVHGFERYQAENFNRYVAFLDYVGIPHVFNTYPEGNTAPMDALIAAQDFGGPIVPFADAPREEMLARNGQALDIMKHKYLVRQDVAVKTQCSNMQKQIKHLRQEHTSLQKKYDATVAELDASRTLNEQLMASPWLYFKDRLLRRWPSLGPFKHRLVAVIRREQYREGTSDN